MKIKRERSEYKRNYRRFQRHIDYHLGQILENGKKYSIDEIQAGLLEETGFKFQKGTIRSLIEKYRDFRGISPFEEFYQINSEYFEKFASEVRPSRTYNKS